MDMWLTLGRTWAHQIFHWQKIFGRCSTGSTADPTHTEFFVGFHCFQTFLVSWGDWPNIPGILTPPNIPDTSVRVTGQFLRKPLIDGTPWAMEFGTRPTDNGYSVSSGDKFDALILPKDRCDTIVYADGLLPST